MPALYLIGPQDDFGTITKKKAHSAEPVGAKPSTGEESKGDVSVELAAVVDEKSTVEPTTV